MRHMLGLAHDMNSIILHSAPNPAATDWQLPPFWTTILYKYKKTCYDSQAAKKNMYHVVKMYSLVICLWAK